MSLVVLSYGIRMVLMEITSGLQKMASVRVDPVHQVDWLGVPPPAVVMRISRPVSDVDPCSTDASGRYYELRKEKPAHHASHPRNHRTRRQPWQ
jgi:hypothetical protein